MAFLSPVPTLSTGQALARPEPVCLRSGVEKSFNDKRRLPSKGVCKGSGRTIPNLAQPWYAFVCAWSQGLKLKSNRHGQIREGLALCSAHLQISTSVSSNSDLTSHIIISSLFEALIRRDRTQSQGQYVARSRDPPENGKLLPPETKKNAGALQAKGSRLIYPLGGITSFHLRDNGRGLARRRSQL